MKGAGEGEWKGRGSVRGATGQSHFFNRFAVATAAATGSLLFLL